MLATRSLAAGTDLPALQRLAASPSAALTAMVSARSPAGVEVPCALM